MKKRQFRTSTCRVTVYYNLCVRYGVEPDFLNGWQSLRIFAFQGRKCDAELPGVTHFTLLCKPSGQWTVDTIHFVKTTWGAWVYSAFNYYTCLFYIVVTNTHSTQSINFLTQVNMAFK